jgi:hypothetical protein
MRQTGVLLPALLLAACAAAPPVVTIRDAPQTAPRYAVAGDTPAASEVRRQLQARGHYADDAPVMIRTGFAATPRRTGTCAGSGGDKGCAEWLDAPQSGFAPFAPPLRYRLTLVVDGGQVIVTKAGGKQDQPLPELVGVALDALLKGSAGPRQP